MKDYVLREDVLRCVEEDGHDCELDLGYYDHNVAFQEIIKNIPAADVRPVARGKWRLYSPLTDTYECDKCGYQVIDESFRTNFCPNCGADMREES